MAFWLGGMARLLCRLPYKIPAVLRLVVESIPGGLHLFPAPVGQIETAPWRLDLFAGHALVRRELLFRLGEKLRHLPVVGPLVHIVGSLFPILPEHHNIPRREGMSLVIGGMFYVEAAVNLVQCGVLVQRRGVDKLVILPVHRKPVRLQVLIGTIAEVAPLRAGGTW